MSEIHHSDIMAVILGTVTPYGYTPSENACLSYLVLFIVLTAVHCGVAVRSRYWVALVTLVPGGLRKY